MPEPEQDNREQREELIDSIIGHPELKRAEESEAPPDISGTQEFYGRHAPADDKPRDDAPAGTEEAPQAAESAQTIDTPAPTAPTRSAEELEREIADLRAKVQERNTENLALKAVNDHMQQIAAAVRPPEPPKRPERIPIAFDEQNQPYVNPQVLEQMITERAAQIADERVAASLQPITQASTAYTRMKREFPEFNTDEGEFGAWLETHPQYRDRVSSDPDSGLESAYLRYRYEAGQAQQQHTAQNVAAAQNVVTSAQRHAAPAGGAATPTRRTTEVEARQQRLESLAKYAQETGDWKPYYKARLEEGIGESFLNTMSATTWGR